MKKKKLLTKVYIPHLHYTVYLIDKKGKEMTTIATTFRNDKNSSSIFMEFPLRINNMATLGHELIHVLQFICRDRGIDFVDEMEHTAYIFNYLFNEFTGFKYE